MDANSHVPTRATDSSEEVVEQSEGSDKYGSSCDEGSSESASRMASPGCMTRTLILLFGLACVMIGLSIAVAIWMGYSAWDVASTVQLGIAIASLLLLVFCMVKLVGVSQRMILSSRVDPDRSSAILKTALESLAVWRTGETFLQLPAIKALEKWLHSLSSDPAHFARAVLSFKRNIIRVGRGLMVILFCVGILASFGYLVQAVGVMLSHVQTQRIGEQNLLLRTQNHVTAQNQGFVQAQALADTEFEAAESILLSLDSPLSLQEQKLRQLPEIAAMQVPVLQLEPTLDAGFVNFVTFPNAGRVRSLLLAYMRLDRVARVRSAGKQDSQSSKKPVVEELDPSPYDYDYYVSYGYGPDMYKPDQSLWRLAGVSQALLESLHRLGPILHHASAPIVSDEQISNLPSLWSIGRPSDRVRQFTFKDAQLMVPRENPHVIDFPIEPEPVLVWRLDLRHLAPNDFRGWQASCLDARKARFPSGSVFSNSQLQMCDFTNASIEAADFENANLQGTCFRSAFTKSASFGMANMQQVSFSQCELRTCNFRSARMVDSNFEDCKLTGALFHDAELQSAVFSDCQMNRANLCSANLQGVSIVNNSTLEEALLKGASLQGATLDGVNLSGTSFVNCQLAGALFRKVKLQGTDLSGSWIFPQKVRVDLRAYLCDDTIESAYCNVDLPATAFVECAVGDHEFWEPSNSSIFGYNFWFHRLEQCRSQGVLLDKEFVSFAQSVEDRPRFPLGWETNLKQLISGVEWDTHWNRRKHGIEFGTSLSYRLAKINSADLHVYCDEQFVGAALKSLPEEAALTAREAKSSEKGTLEISRDLHRIAFESAVTAPEKLDVRLEWRFEEELWKLRSSSR